MANHNQVAHAWANQTGKHRKGFNMYYDGPVIYSYGPHFPIARIVRPGLVLFTSRSYSISTSKHKSYVLRAIDGLPYHVFNVMAETKAEHRENYKAMIESAKAHIAAARKSRSRGEYELAAASSDLHHADDYSRVFKLGYKPVSFASLGLTENEATDIRLKCFAWLATQNVRNAAREATRRANQAKRQREQDAKARGVIKQWVRGESVQPPHTSRVYVRVKGNKVETSWGASVPLADALRLWAAMKETRENRLIFNAGFKVGDFTVDRVTSNYAKIGCHLIPYRYARCAAKLAGIE